MPEKIDIFKAALGNKAYLATINKSSKAQAEFITTLSQNKFSPQEIIELAQVVNDKQMRSLFIIHLLSQKEYLNSLKGESLLDRMDKKIHRSTPSRLNAWIHQLDITVLTPALIQRLDSEAAVSILCSVPHFHQLTEAQVNALLHKHLEPELIIYWVKHFSHMPNAHYVLASLMKLVNTNIIDALSELEIHHKETVLTTIMTHLNLFHPLPKRLLTHLNSESHLILAMRLYLNGHFYHAYALFIEQLTQSLLNKQHNFSLATIELLFSLNDSSELGNTITRTKMITNRYLMTCAQEGNSTPFYRNGHINIHRMSQSMHVIDGAEDCPLIKSLIKHNKSISYFEYFLIYYQGKIIPISQMLHDYLNYYSQQEKSFHRDKVLHHLGFLLTRDELNPEVKETLFATLLHHPELFDEFICHRLFLFNATKTIQHFGLRGGEKNYHIVITLCTNAIAKLNPEQHQHIIQIAEKARTEAELELRFSKEQGFFSSLIKHIKRCWIYGWTGLFTPNPPQYVIPEPEILHHTSSDERTIFLNPYMQPVKELPDLLQEIQQHSVIQEQLEELISALQLYSLKEGLKDEFETRLKLHHLINHIINHKDENTGLHAWLMGNLEPFIRNQFRLLELSFKEKSPSEINTFCIEINECSDQLNYVTDELHCVTPEQKHDGTAMTSQTTTSQKSGTLDKANEFMAEYANTLVESAQKTASTVSDWINSSWAGGLGGLFSSGKEKKHSQQTTYAHTLLTSTPEH